MKDSEAKPRFPLTLAVLSWSGGLVGAFLGLRYAGALNTTPAWLGPAILVGSLALVLAGVLALPAAIRALRHRRSGPAP
ncbi:hypothetical protein QFW77_02640 [Luteimonas sp. RD2P54]|uniref:Uncharacterized protein n=1 Tax=Luteimonas endophytica TaxID=3042023 RepID=A0ABT6J6U6_9GAMM|nr:hypothetical protein [Luteimonas endophytica]MDH5821893.1 hypothetical protein [Luteimonas endophytica]